MRLTTAGTRIHAAFALVTVALSASGCGSEKITFDDMDIDLCAGTSQVVASVPVQPSQVSLRVGFTAQLQAWPLNAQGVVAFCAPAVQWSTSDPSVATVSAGKVVAVGGGKAFIRASSGAKADSAVVTVSAAPIASVAIERIPASPLLIGQTAGLRLVARDADGNVMTPVSIAWQTDNAPIATVSKTGMVIAVAEGSATVSAVAEGVTAVATITVTRDLPVRRFRQIAVGATHGCAIVGGGGIPDGTAFCWGAGAQGQLGTGTNGNSAVPTLVSGGHTFASVAAGASSSCALTALGEAYCWGSNDQGQLGDGTRTSRAVPVRVNTTTTFRTLVSGGYMTCGLTSAGAAYCWGLAGSTTTLVPTLIPGGLQFADLTSGGGAWVCGRTAAGRAYCWGLFPYAALTPTAVPGGMQFSQISAGENHVCGVAVADSRGYCWGRMDGHLFGGERLPELYETPVVVPGGLRFTSIAPGNGFTCGITATGSYCVGAAHLSNSTRDLFPRLIPKDDLLRMVAISTGSGTACGIDQNGGGWCWGMNYTGQVGAGELETDVTEPLQLRIP